MKRQQPQEQINSDIKEKRFLSFLFFMLTFQVKRYIMNIHSKKTYKDKRGNDTTKEEAIELDRKIQNAWAGHKHFRIIDNSTDFENKIDRLIKEVNYFIENL